MKKHQSFTADDAAFLANETKAIQSLVSTFPPESEEELAERARAQKDVAWQADTVGKDVETVKKGMADAWKTTVREDSAYWTMQVLTGILFIVGKQFPERVSTFRCRTLL